MKIRRKKRKMMKIENSDTTMKDETEELPSTEKTVVPLSEKTESVEVEKNSVNICRLCLVFIDDNFIPLENILAMLQIVLPEVVCISMSTYYVWIIVFKILYFYILGVPFSIIITNCTIV